MKEGEKRIFPFVVVTVPVGLALKRGSGGEWREKVWEKRCESARMRERDYFLLDLFLATIFMSFMLSQKAL